MKFKKPLSLLLAAVLLCAFAVPLLETPALAADKEIHEVATAGANSARRFDVLRGFWRTFGCAFFILRQFAAGKRAAAARFLSFRRCAERLHRRILTAY